jgi:2,5-diamino-6-(ribosylamino)-4(3H)-pyrimidinone 5'-phosphate reductase
MSELPRVILHNEVSVDGRVTDFEVHLGVYYELASRFEEDATLAGAGTILAPTEEVTEETEEDLVLFAQDPDLGRPSLIIPDSRGRVRLWHMLRRYPFWGRFIALVSETTPEEYLEYLEERNIDVISTGSDHVDLRTALGEVRVRYGVRVVRADSGGTLNGVLLKEDLVDELSILLNASLVGSDGTTPFVTSPPGWTEEDTVKLRLTSVERMDDDLVWLRYEVVR